LLIKFQSASSMNTRGANASRRGAWSCVGFELSFSSFYNTNTEIGCYFFFSNILLSFPSRYPVQHDEWGKQRCWAHPIQCRETITDDNNNDDKNLLVCMIVVCHSCTSNRPAARTEKKKDPHHPPVVINFFIPPHQNEKNFKIFLFQSWNKKS
jgi:hypothetical protein